MSDSADPEDGGTWISVIDEVVDEGIDRHEVVELTAEDLTIDVPLRFGPNPDRAHWRFDGTVRVSVDGETGPLADWMQFWYRRRQEERKNAKRAGMEADGDGGSEATLESEGPDASGD